MNEIIDIDKTLALYGYKAVKISDIKAAEARIVELETELVGMKEQYRGAVDAGGTLLARCAELETENRRLQLDNEIYIREAGHALVEFEEYEVAEVRIAELERVLRMVSPWCFVVRLGWRCQYCGVVHRDMPGDDVGHAPDCPRQKVLNGIEQWNARLIAAAPELLEMLENLLSVPASDTARVQKAWDNARTVVAKAKGEQVK